MNTHELSPLVREYLMNDHNYTKSCFSHLLCPIDPITSGRDQYWLHRAVVPGVFENRAEAAAQ